MTYKKKTAGYVQEYARMRLQQQGPIDQCNLFLSETVAVTASVVLACDQAPRITARRSAPTR